MTTAPTPSELLALRAGAMQQIRLREKFGPEGLDLELDPAIVIRLLDRIQDLEGKVGRFQGVPMALIEAINAATGSNEWQGDNSPAELLEPACRAITARQVAYQALQTENERLRMELVAEARAAAEHKLRADQLAQQHRMQAQMHAQATQQLAELEARKPLPLSYRSGVMTSSIDGGATASLHFNDMAEAEAWFVAITDQHDAGLVDKSPNLQEPLVDKTANLQDRPKRKPLPPDALADKCEAWLQSGGATNIPDAFEAGYRAAEAAAATTKGEHPK